MQTTEKQQTPFPKLQIIDLDSPFFVGIGYEPSAEEKLEMGVEEGDARPMSVLGVTADGVAAIDCHGSGRQLADLFCAAPQLLKALHDLMTLAYDVNASDAWKEEMDAAQAAITQATGGAK